MTTFSIASPMSSVSSGIVWNNFSALDLNAVRDEYSGYDKLMMFPLNFSATFDY